MHKFWKACAEESADVPKLQDMWRNHKSENIEDCIRKATETWQAFPFLTELAESTCAMWHAMTAKDSFRRSEAHAKSAYKIMELVGRFTAEDQWSAACALVCYRASEKLQSELFSEQSHILDELYQRITHPRTEEEKLHDVMTFWGRLNEYRENECRDMLHSSKEQSVTPCQASQMVEHFKYNQLWYELTYAQKQSHGWNSTLQTILHRRAGWTHAAKAIMQYGLPKLERPAQPNDATEHINALVQFAENMAKSLQNFTTTMHAYKQTPKYQKNYDASIDALKKRRTRARESY